MAAREFTNLQDIKSNLKKPLYSAIFLNGQSRDKLLDWWSPHFNNIKAHHITISFGSDDVSPFSIGQNVIVRATGQGYDDKCQAAVINIKGFPTALWYRGTSFPHITISHDNNIKPYYSNDLLKHKFTHVFPLEIEGVVGIFGVEK